MTYPTTRDIPAVYVTRVAPAMTFEPCVRVALRRRGIRNVGRRAQEASDCAAAPAPGLRSERLSSRRGAGAVQHAGRGACGDRRAG